MKMNILSHFTNKDQNLNKKKDRSTNDLTFDTCTCQNREIYMQTHHGVPKSKKKRVGQSIPLREEEHGWRRRRMRSDGRRRRRRRLEGGGGVGREEGGGSHGERRSGDGGKKEAGGRALTPCPRTLSHHWTRMWGKHSRANAVALEALCHEGKCRKING